MKTIETYNETLKTNPSVFVRNILIELKNNIKKVIDSDIIIYSFLFGSYARSEATESSDIDICYIYDNKKISEKDINLIVDDICYTFGNMYDVSINALCFSKEYYFENKNSSKLFLNIEQEGIKC